MAMYMYLSKGKATAFSVWFLKDAIMLPLAASTASVTHWIISVKPDRKGRLKGYSVPTKVLEIISLLHPLFY